jgi:hypothetical protein
MEAWSKGHFGKGVLWPDRTLETWRLPYEHGSPHHQEVDTQQQALAYLNIDDEGNVDLYPGPTGEEDVGNYWATIIAQEPGLHLKGIRSYWLEDDDNIGGLDDDWKFGASPAPDMLQASKSKGRSTPEFEMPIGGAVRRERSNQRPTASTTITDESSESVASHLDVHPIVGLDNDHGWSFGSSITSGAEPKDSIRRSTHTLPADLSGNIAGDSPHSTNRTGEVSSRSRAVFQMARPAAKGRADNHTGTTLIGNGHSMPTNVALANQAIRNAINHSQRIATRRQASKLKWLLERGDKKLMTPEGLRFFESMAKHVDRDEKIDALTPWLAREWKRGRLHHSGNAANYSYAPLHPEPGLVTLDGGKLSHWADWYHSNHPTRRGQDIMQMQMHDMHNKIGEWEEALKEEAKQRQDVENEEQRNGGKILHQFDDGWSVRQLGPENLQWEGDRMASDEGYPICVGDQHYQDRVRRGNTHILSLRDEQGYPHVTAELTPKYYADPVNGDIHDFTNTRDGRPMYEPMIDQANIEQIQGKGNQIPKPEYQQRLKEYFETFPEEFRPQWQGEEVTEPEELYTHPSSSSLPQPGGHGNGGYEPHGDYGVKITQPADYEYLLSDDKLLGLPRWRGYDWNGDTQDNVDAIYLHALENRRIPEFAKAVEQYGEKANESFADLEEQNLHYLPPYPGESPEEAKEMGHVYDPDEPEWFSSWGDHHEAYEDARRELANDHPPTQASTYMHQLLEPHYHPDSPEDRSNGLLRQPDISLAGYYNNFARHPMATSLGRNHPASNYFEKVNGEQPLAWRPKYEHMFDIEPQGPSGGDINKLTSRIELDGWSGLEETEVERPELVGIVIDGVERNHVVGTEAMRTNAQSINGRIDKTNAGHTAEDTVPFHNDILSRQADTLNQIEDQGGVVDHCPKCQRQGTWLGLVPSQDDRWPLICPGCLTSYADNDVRLRSPDFGYRGPVTNPRWNASAKVLHDDEWNMASLSENDSIKVSSTRPFDSLDVMPQARDMKVDRLVAVRGASRVANQLKTSATSPVVDGVESTIIEGASTTLTGSHSDIHLSDIIGGNEDQGWSFASTGGTEPIARSEQRTLPMTQTGLAGIVDEEITLRPMRSVGAVGHGSQSSDIHGGFEVDGRIAPDTSPYGADHIVSSPSTATSTQSGEATVTLDDYSTVVGDRSADPGFLGAHRSGMLDAAYQGQGHGSQGDHLANVDLDHWHVQDAEPAEEMNGMIFGAETVAHSDIDDISGVGLDVNRRQVFIPIPITASSEQLAEVHNETTFDAGRSNHMSQDSNEMTHQLNFQHGSYGKGFITNDGIIHTWNVKAGDDVFHGRALYLKNDQDGAPSHYAYAESQGLDPRRDISTHFAINPDGALRVNPKHDRDAQLLKQLSDPQEQWRFGSDKPIDIHIPSEIPPGANALKSDWAGIDIIPTIDADGISDIGHGAGSESSSLLMTQATGPAFDGWHEDSLQGDERSIAIGLDDVSAPSTAITNSHQGSGHASDDFTSVAPVAFGDDVAIGGRVKSHESQGDEFEWHSAELDRRSRTEPTEHGFEVDGSADWLITDGASHDSIRYIDANVMPPTANATDAGPIAVGIPAHSLQDTSEVDEIVLNDQFDGRPSDETFATALDKPSGGIHRYPFSTKLPPRARAFAIP